MFFVAVSVAVVFAAFDSAVAVAVAVASASCCFRCQEK